MEMSVSLSARNQGIKNKSRIIGSLTVRSMLYALVLLGLMTGLSRAGGGFFTVSPDNTVVSFSSASGAPPIMAPGTYDLARTGTVTTTNDACTALPAGSLTGKIGLIRRGTCSFYIKVSNAQAAGAIGVILYNNVTGTLTPSVTPTGGNPALTIPVVAITQADGALINNRMDAGPVTTTWNVQVTEAQASKQSVTLKTGDTVYVSLFFSTVVSSPGLDIALNSGTVLHTGPFSGVSSWRGVYTVAPGENAPILEISAITGTISDSFGNSASNPVVPAQLGLARYALLIDGISANVATDPVSEVTSSSAMANGNLLYGGASGITDLGLCWGTAPNPAIGGTCSQVNIATGPFSAPLGNFIDGMPFHVRAYATGSSGTIYGKDMMVEPGNSLSFDGINDRITHNYYYDLYSTGFTAETWVKFSGTPAGATELIFSQGPATTPTWALLATNRIPGFTMWSGTELQSIYAPEAVQPDTWYHLAGTFDGTTQSFYINGRLIGSRTSTVTTFTSIYIGGDTSPTNYLSGSLDDLQLWGVARTQDEIRNTISVPATGNEADIALYYNFDSGTAGLDNTALGTRLENMVPISSAYYGTLVNFALTGASSNFVASGAFLPLNDTAAVTNLLSRTASGGGVVLPNVVLVTSRGVCWSLNPEPTLADSCTTDGPGSGDFVSSITGLLPSTQYYLRSYAANASGISYGPALTFATPADPNVSVTTDGNGSGNVLSSPPGISCPDTCTASFGLPLQLTATASEGSTVVWSGDCSSTSGDGTVYAVCAINSMNSDKNVKATFTLNSYTMTGNISGGTNTIDCTSPVLHGFPGSCSLTIDQAWHLTSFTDNHSDAMGNLSGLTYSILSVKEDHDIYAVTEEYKARVMSTGNYYDTISAAYAGADVVDILRLRAVDFMGDVDLNRLIDVALRGGYQSGFGIVSGYSTIIGQLVISGANVVIDKIIIQ